MGQFIKITRTTSHTNTIYEYKCEVCGKINQRYVAKSQSLPKFCPRKKNNCFFVYMRKTYGKK